MDLSCCFFVLLVVIILGFQKCWFGLNIFYGKKDGFDSVVEVQMFLVTSKLLKYLELSIHSLTVHLSLV